MQKLETAQIGYMAATAALPASDRQLVVCGLRTSIFALTASCPLPVRGYMPLKLPQHPCISLGTVSITAQHAHAHHSFALSANPLLCRRLLWQHICAGYLVVTHFLFWSLPQAFFWAVCPCCLSVAELPQLGSHSWQRLHSRGSAEVWMDTAAACVFRHADGLRDQVVCMWAQPSAVACWWLGPGV
jgi:hypothetical protein